MATSTAPKTEAKAPAAKRAPIDLVTRTKAQLSTAALKSKITVEQLETLEAHIGKLKALLA